MARSELEKEFLSDHRKMTRTFRDLIEAVESNDWQSCQELAVRLNRIAGPHIEFEEAVLYPRVDCNSEEPLTAQLKEEHDTARKAIAFLVELNGPLLECEQERIRQQLQVGFDHAVACGGLLSHLTAADAATQAEMLSTLRQLRLDERRWTDLPNRGDSKEFTGNCEPNALASGQP